MIEHSQDSRLKTEELLLLEILTYLKDDEPLRSLHSYRGKTVGELLNSIRTDGLDDYKQYGSYILGRDWRNIIFAIRKNPVLMATVIKETHIDKAYGGGGGIAAVFSLQNSDETVIAFRGTAPHEWLDDFRGGTEIDTPQQLNALEWYRTVYKQLHLERRFVTLTGHSKGGNKAKYITILDDTVRRCVSFDGQGFSDAFVENYTERILTRQKYIENHNVDYDYVSILLNDIGARHYYCGFGYGKGGFVEAHCPNTFFKFDEYGGYEMVPSPSGQGKEMETADSFINVFIRTMQSDAVLVGTMRLLGNIVEENFVRVAEPWKEGKQITFVLDLLSREENSDLAAGLLAFIISYGRVYPAFYEAMGKLASRFGMGAAAAYIDTVRAVLVHPAFDKMLRLSDYVAGHVPPPLQKRLTFMLKQRCGADLSTLQLQQLLSIITKAKLKMDGLCLAKDDADLTADRVTGPVVVRDLGVYQLKVLVLAGGYSADRNYSLRTGYAVAEALRSTGNRVILADSYLGCPELRPAELENPFAYAERISLPNVEMVSMVPDLWTLNRRREPGNSAILGPNIMRLAQAADIVFVALLSAYEGCGRLQAALDIAGVAYTGSGYLANALSGSKYMTKRLLRSNGIKTPEWINLQRCAMTKLVIPEDLAYPVVVKPEKGGSGIGVGKADDREELFLNIEEAFQWETDVLLEQYVAGREYSVCFLNGEILPIVEVTRDAKAYDYRLRYAEYTRDLCCPADTGAELKLRLAELALTVGESVGAEKLFRVDMIVDDNNQAYVLEIDTQPELTGNSLFAVAAAAAGISFPDLCQRILESAL